MTFVCERCAEGLPPGEVDEHATYPDERLGGTDPLTGGHLCGGCVRFDNILREVLVRDGRILPTTAREVLMAEEAMKNEPGIELPRSLRDPYELMGRRPDVFGPKGGVPNQQPSVSGEGWRSYSCPQCAGKMPRADCQLCAGTGLCHEPAPD